MSADGESEMEQAGQVAEAPKSPSVTETPVKNGMGKELSDLDAASSSSKRPLLSLSAAESTSPRSMTAASFSVSGKYTEGAAHNIRIHAYLATVHTFARGRLMYVLHFVAPDAKNIIRGYRYNIGRAYSPYAYASAAKAMALLKKRKVGSRLSRVIQDICVCLTNYG